MATFVLVNGTGSTQDDWAALVEDLEDRGDRCLLVDISSGQGEDQADRIAWAAQRSPTSPVLVVHGNAGAHVPGALARFRFAHVVWLTAEVPAPESTPEQDWLTAPQTYVGDPEDQVAKKAALTVPEMETEELTGGPCPQVSRPEEVARILARCARKQATGVRGVRGLAPERGLGVAPPV
ncbi:MULTISPECIES: hypothetical protein [unclassified Crossiella]|uniref:hypothetical protein n=1 Tax=unclassified Crossiella TaxID=2620835 RepID=UPI001FFE7145|nr:MULTISPECIES: hypothetical protein [unclassified Crossiella]MCK2237476.1 hypothetical protein [Crossiella sp. S99.2]MCK2254762.1 hypothetical protein [Crossiella sp. S99.1]